MEAREGSVDPKLEGIETVVTWGGFNVSIGSGRRLLMTCVKGQFQVHVRECRTRGGKDCANRKGLTFTPGRLMALWEKVEKIDEKLQQQDVSVSLNISTGAILYKVHLGAGIFVTISDTHHGASLHRYWVPDGEEEPIPTEEGVYLTGKQWSVLKVKLEALLIANPALAGAKVCSSTHDIMQMDYLKCRECLPFSLDTVYGERF